MICLWVILVHLLALIGVSFGDETLGSHFDPPSTGGLSQADLLQKLQSDACQKHWNASGLTPWASFETVFSNGVFSPTGPALASPRPIRRMLTWEDVEQPFSKPATPASPLQRMCTWAVPGFYGTPERLTKTLFSTLRGGLRPFVFIPIWKAASTSVSILLREHAGGSSPHRDYQRGCKLMAPTAARTANGTAAQDSATFRALVKQPAPLPGSFHPHLNWGSTPPLVFTFVRDPLDRYLAAVRTVQFSPPQPSNATCLRGMNPAAVHEALKSGIYFDWAEHLRSQSYFLAATQADGTPLQLGFIGRQEHMQTDMPELLRLLGMSPQRIARALDMRHSRHDMPANATVWTRENVPDDVVREVCRIYAQDYACLGYALPEQCRTGA